MFNQELIDNISQQKLNALIAIQLHRKCISQLRQKNRFIESLSIAVPAFYIVPRFLAKGTAFATFIDGLGEILAAILLVLSILKLVNKWQEDEVRHSIMLRRNADTIQEADQLLARQTTNLEVVEQFLIRVKDVDDEDEDLLPDTDIKKMEKQEACREALRRFSPSEITVCPVCGANPWDFTPGSCQACGGTPVQSGTSKWK